MIQKRVVEERTFTTRNRLHAMGRTSAVADCPFCGRAVVIYLWSIAGVGKKLCACGAALHADYVARKCMEVE